MEFTTQAALIIAGIVLVLSGVFGIGATIGAVVIPKLAGWQRGILIGAGVLLILLGLALEPDFWDVLGRTNGSGDVQQSASSATASPVEAGASENQAESTVNENGIDTADSLGPVPPASTPAVISTATDLPQSQPEPTASASTQQNPAELREIGFEHHHAGRYSDAVVVFGNCVQTYPTFGDCYNGLGMTQRELGDFTSSIESHDRAVALVPTRYDYYWERGVTRLRMAAYDDAIADFQKCIELNPGFGNCYTGTAMAFRDRGQYESALPYHDQAIIREPNRGDFYWERAVTYQKMGNNAQAEADFAAARERNYSQ